VHSSIWEKLAKDNKLDSLKTVELEGICRSKGWTCTGNKSDLIKEIRIKMGLQSNQIEAVKEIMLNGKALKLPIPQGELKQLCKDNGLPVSGTVGALWERLVLLSQGKWVPPSKERVRRSTGASPSTTASAKSGSKAPRAGIPGLEDELGGALFMLEPLGENCTKEQVFAKEHLLLPKSFSKVKTEIKDIEKAADDWDYGDTSLNNMIWDSYMSNVMMEASVFVTSKLWRDALASMLVIALYTRMNENWLWDNEFYDYDAENFWIFFESAEDNWKAILEQTDAVLGLELPKGKGREYYREMLNKVVRGFQRTLNSAVNNDNENEGLRRASTKTTTKQSFP